MKNINVGDKIRIKKGEKIFEGLLMPGTELGDEKHLVLKLDSGYNIGISTEGAKIEKLQTKTEKLKKLRESAPEIRGLPAVTLIGTGGTIASKIDYKTGAVHPAFSASEIINAVPEIAKIANIKTELLFNILSENMKAQLWLDIAKECAGELNAGAYGVVVAHGTDTLAYTSAALSFMLQNLSKPVVLVGSQRSSDRPSSDSSMNLVSAVKVACADLGEVVAVMHGSSSDDYCLIHRGTRVRKMHASRRDAFKSINDAPLGEVRDEVKITQGCRKRSDGKVRVNDKLEEKVALVKIYPGFSDKLLNYFVENYKGIVIEGTGLGHVSTDLFRPIENAKKEGVPIVMTSQTVYGRVNMNVYSTGRELLARGVIPVGDMLSEVAYVKLMHVLGNAKDYDDVRKIMQTNVAGEISERTKINAFEV